MENSRKIGREMNPGFQMLIHWGHVQIVRHPSMGLQLSRLRAQEREIQRQRIGHTPKHDPGRAIMTLPTLAVHLDLWNSRMVCGGPSVKSLYPEATRKFEENWARD